MRRHAERRRRTGDAPGFHFCQRHTCHGALRRDMRVYDPPPDILISPAACQPDAAARR